MRFFQLKSFAYLLLVIGILVAFWYILLGGFFHGSIIEPDPAKAMQIQPFMTGLVAPLFTLASTLLVIVNLSYQTRQNFVSNFFNLLNQHHKLLDNILCEVEGYSSSDKPSYKKDFFDDLASRIAYDFYYLNSNCSHSIEEYKGKSANLEPYPNTGIDAKNLNGLEKLKKIYDHYFHLHHSELSHYFRNLFHLVKFIDKQPFTKKEKRQYGDILRAQLSNYELVILAYDGLHEYGKAFKPLIEKYKLVKSINDETRLHNRYERRIVPIEILHKEYPSNFL